MINNPEVPREPVITIKWPTPRNYLHCSLRQGRSFLQIKNHIEFLWENNLLTVSSHSFPRHPVSVLLADIFEKAE